MPPEGGREGAFRQIPITGTIPAVLHDPHDEPTDIATTAARLVVEEGLEYGPAKRRAVKLLGLPARAPLPANDAIEEAVHAYISLFCSDTQPGELAALRALALRWMDRMQHFRPHLGGSVWHGTATRRSDIHLDLFCDDSKSAEMVLIDHRADYETRTATGLRGEPVDVLASTSSARGWEKWWACTSWCMTWTTCEAP